MKDELPVADGVYKNGYIGKLNEITTDDLPISPQVEECSSTAMADFAYRKDNNRTDGEPPSMVYEMAEKAWKLWHLEEYIDSLILKDRQKQREEMVEKTIGIVLNHSTPSNEQMNIVRAIRKL